MQNSMPFHSQLWENIETQVIHQDHWSFHLYLSQCHPLHKLISLKLYIGETRRRQLSDWFGEHLPDLAKSDKNAFKPIARHFNLPYHSKQHMAVCGLSLHQGLAQKAAKPAYNKNSALLLLTVQTNNFHLTNLFCFSRCHAQINSVAPSFCI